MAKKLFWIDLEMTGLDENIHVILEVAAVITDILLNPLDQYHQIVYQPEETLKNMDEWCVKTHRASGLTAAVPNGKPIDEVEHDLIKLLNPHFTGNDRIVLAGNSVNNDRRFIDKYMPDLARKLHYRLVDVSSFKEIFRDRYGIEIKKGNAHRAVDDIFESIHELETYLALVVPPKKDES